MTGTIRSPNYPRDYGNDMRCVWSVQAPVGYYIRFEFGRSLFDVQQSPLCEDDYVWVSVYEEKEIVESWDFTKNYFNNFFQSSRLSILVRRDGRLKP
jgi:hypothetical protein